MDIDALLKPISDDAPCGPDLNAGMDPAYEDYYFGALERIPTFYFRPGVDRPDGSRSPDQIFDASSVDHAAEAKSIDALLARSRDLRLLVLRAQWEALAGRIGPMSEAIEGVAGLLETFGDAVHPTLESGHGERRDALSDLNQSVAVVQPLMFLSLTSSGDVTLRKIRVAHGKAQPMEGEDDLAPGMMTEALSDSANRKRVEGIHTGLVRILDCLQRIDKVCKSNAQAPFSPSFQDLTQTVSEILDAINTACPDLSADIPSRTDDDDDALPDVATDTPQAAPAIVEAPTSDVANHAHAKGILEACETYYRRYEPSSAALLLVTQARLLIGKPLIEALETLLPAQAGKAIVDFGPQTGFALTADKLKALTSAAPDSAAAEASADPAPAPVAITSAAEAAGAMRSVEDYFRRAERSSPVPVLLQRARSYLEKDFQSLVDELIPRAPAGKDE